MTFDTKATASAAKMVSLRRAPSQLRDGVHTFLSLVKMHPDIHPAVLAAVLARPAGERRALLEAVRLGDRPDRLTHSEAMSSDSDDIWEDAVEDLEANTASMSTVGDGGSPMAAMASVAVDVATEVDMLEREAALCHQAWQQSRQLSSWTRYTECRKRLAEISKQHCDEEERSRRWEQLQMQREVHERRLAELSRRRERLRLSQQYDAQTRQHHVQLAQAQLQAKMRELDERQQVRRLEHMKRVQQLMRELAEDEQRDAKPRVVASTSSASSTSSTSSASSESSAHPDDEFTHVWDDFSHWEKMVDDDVLPGSPKQAKSVTANQPDLIPVPAPVWGGTPTPSPTPNPVLPAMSGQAGPWRADTVTSGQGDLGFAERKRWFEEALLSWHAQDEEEDFGTTLYGAGSGGVPSPWFHSAWSAWQNQGPSPSVGVVYF